MGRSLGSYAKECQRKLMAVVQVRQIDECHPDRRNTIVVLARIVAWCQLFDILKNSCFAVALFVLYRRQTNVFEEKKKCRSLCSFFANK